MFLDTSNGRCCPGSLKWAWLPWAMCAGAVRCGQDWEEAGIGEVERKTRVKEEKNKSI